jgi:peptidoglycan/xylan/chitin deacetylase (PgdA/CDA1 family)
MTSQHLEMSHVEKSLGVSLLHRAMRRIVRLTAPAGNRAGLCVLVYHRVRSSDDKLDTWNPTAEEFEGQMALLSACFEPLRLTEAVERLKSRSLPRGAVAVTFDDGYADNFEVALPILRRHHVPATFFISTGYLDGGRMWNDTVVEAVRAADAPTLDLSASGMGLFPLATDEQRRAAIFSILAELKYLPTREREARAAGLEAMARVALPRNLMLVSEQVRALHEAGMEIGAHTVTHPILAQLDGADARREIHESRDHLRSILRNPVTLFAYPNGKPGRDYLAEHVQMVREAGFRAALSTAPGAATSAADSLQLPRISPWQRTPGRFGLALIRSLWS